MQNSIDLSIVLVNYNSKDHLQRCLESIYAHARGIRLEVWIVDNSQPNENLDSLVESFPGTQVVYNRSNVGFGTAQNEGFRRASGRYVLVLNPDTRFSSDLLDRLVQELDAHADIDIATVKILAEDGAVERPFWRHYSVGRLLLSEFFNVTIKASTPYTLERLSQIQDVEIISGAFMVMRQTALRRLGGFDERIFLYAEDAEICMRAHKLGMRLCYLPLEGVVHVGHGSTSVRSAGTSEVVLFNGLKSRMYVARKHLPPLTARLIAWITLAGALYRGVGFVLAGTLAGRPGWRRTGRSYLRAFQRLLRP